MVEQNSNISCLPYNFHIVENVVNVNILYNLMSNLNEKIAIVNIANEQARNKLGRNSKKKRVLLKSESISLVVSGLKYIKMLKLTGIQAQKAKMGAYKQRNQVIVQTLLGFNKINF